MYRRRFKLGTYSVRVLPQVVALDQGFEKMWSASIIHVAQQNTTCCEKYWETAPMKIYKSIVSLVSRYLRNKFNILTTIFLFTLTYLLS